MVIALSLHVLPEPLDLREFLEALVLQVRKVTPENKEFKESRVYKVSQDLKAPWDSVLPIPFACKDLQAPRDLKVFRVKRELLD
jgi:hypothetical protein